MCIKNGGSLDLNGYSLTVTGDFTLGEYNCNSNTALFMNKGQLYISGDFSISERYNDSKLHMQNPEDYLYIGGSFFTEAYYNSVLTDGVIEIRGNFTQEYTGYTDNFLPSGSHKIILSGIGLQIVSFERIESGFNIVDVQNFSLEGVSFLTPVTQRCIAKFLTHQAQIL